MADLIAVNKSDGDRLMLAKQTKGAYRNAIHLFPAKLSQWIVKVLNCSATSGEGIKEIWEAIQAYQEFTKDNNYFQEHRQKQAKYWLYETVELALKTRFFKNPQIATQLAAIETEVVKERLSPFKAAEMLLTIYKNQEK